MGKTVIKETSFSEIVDQYNTGGKTAAYDLIRSKYGLKYPNFVISRIKKCGKFTYDAENDRFLDADASASDGVFLNLDELCSSTDIKATRPTASFQDNRPAAIEKLIHELLVDRLLTLSRYITVDSSARKVLIDQTSLSTDGYQVITH